MAEPQNNTAFRPFDILCKCGRINEFGLKICLSCKKPLEVVPTPPPLCRGETLKRYAARVGTIYVTEQAK